MKPQVMGILNVTPDSFYDGGLYCQEKAIITQVEKLQSDGAQIIDIGGYSTRPSATDVPCEEELGRVVSAIHLIIRNFPDCIISVDTFRSEVAKQAVRAGASIINDVSGGELDKKMFQTVAELQVPYILMHMRGTPKTMNEHTDYRDLILEMTDFFQVRIFKLRALGVKDIILDVGLGFAKNIDQNYELLRALHFLKIFELPILVGASRKSMIWKKLHITPAQSLNGTTVINTIALQHGADILRVHDAKEAQETIDLLR